MADYNNERKKYYTFTGRDGKVYELNFKGDDDYYADNPFITTKKEDVANFVQIFLETGTIPDRLTFNNLTGASLDDTEYKMLTKDLKTFIKNNDIDETAYMAAYGPSNNSNDPEGSNDSDEINGVPKDIALDKYFNEWYSGKEGTAGVKVRGELENVFANQANTEMMLADAAFQQQALQQAQTVKSITDQVRAERMARLKAGMSESQIANQDMQMMMANVNALNDQASMMNQGRLQAQANAMNAKDQAYLAYLEQAQGGAQTGAAYSAANAGDLSYQVYNSLVRKYGTNWSPAQERQEILLWSGQGNNS